MPVRDITVTQVTFRFFSELIKGFASYRLISMQDFSGWYATVHHIPHMTELVGSIGGCASCSVALISWGKRDCFAAFRKPPDLHSSQEREQRLFQPVDLHLAPVVCNIDRTAASSLTCVSIAHFTFDGLLGRVTNGSISS